MGTWRTRMGTWLAAVALMVVTVAVSAGPVAPTAPAGATVTVPACAAGVTDGLANCLRTSAESLTVTTTTPVVTDLGLGGSTIDLTVSITALPYHQCSSSSPAIAELPCTFVGMSLGARAYVPGGSAAVNLPNGITFTEPNPSTCATTFSCPVRLVIDSSKFVGNITLIVSAGVGTILTTPNVGYLGSVYRDPRSLDVSSAGLPGAPTIGTATGGKGQASVSWTAPASNGNTPLTGYSVTPSSGFTTFPAQTFGPGASSGTVTGLTNGVVYRLRVAATNKVGTGIGSGVSNEVLPPFSTLTAFITRTYQDVMGRAPTAAELSSASSSLANVADPTSWVVNLRRTTDATTNVDPTTRLYFAYFLRIPDLGGLTYWIGQKRAGKSLYAISDAFAGSGEFKTRYGSLTNAQFVNLVYTNVLGRPADAAGSSYWTGQLNSKAKTRGQVMVGFSESSEYRTLKQAAVDTSVLWIDLLVKSPDQTSFTTWSTGIKAGTKSVAGLVAALLADPAYAARF